MIVPHIIDQFAWNYIVSNKGAGPKGPSIAKLQKQNASISIILENKLVDLMNNDTYKENALKISRNFSNENYESNLLENILYLSSSNGPSNTAN